MMKYLLIGLAVSIGWHIGQIVGEILKETILNNLHAVKWYAVLNKKAPTGPVIKKEKRKTHEPYKDTIMGFKGTKES